LTNSRRKFIKQASISSAAALFTQMGATGEDPSAPVTEVAIIGSGPAGLALADKLSAAGVSVLVIESGVSKPDQLHQDLNTVTGSLEPLESGLGFAGRRAIGGTTHVWGGVCPRFDKTDFSSKREFGYAVDWPIEFAELDSHYCEAERWLRIADVQCGRADQSPFVKSSMKLIDTVKGVGIEQAIPAAMSVDDRGLPNPFNLAILATNNLLFRKNVRLLENTTERKSSRHTLLYTRW